MRQPQITHRFRKKILPILLPWLLSSCANYAVISNQDLTQQTQPTPYSLFDTPHSKGDQDISLVLAFSGGGTRAAALAYGVLLGLRDSYIEHDGKRVRLLDEVDLISSVSGGSFTSAYYGLHGEQTFTQFETDFLRQDMASDLMDRMFSLSTWLSKKSRTEEAVSIYQERVFKGATFADLQAANGPLVVINATDLGKGVRFSFIQEYFDLLCSDLSSFPVARAVTASSAVPVVFSPVALQNHSGCQLESQSYLQNIDEAQLPTQVAQVVDGLKTYSDKQQRRYIHLVDGGISDNLGLMAIYEVVEVVGGIKAFHRMLNNQPAKHIVLISVNASTHVKHQMGASRKEPSIEDTINTMTDVQLHRYNAASQDLMQTTLQRWADELSTPSQRVEPHFVSISFDTLSPPEQDYVNGIPTAFTLENQQIDRLIALGQRLLSENPSYQQLLDSYQ